MGGSSSEKVGFSQSSPTFNITIFIAYFQRVIIKNKDWCYLSGSGFPAAIKRLWL